MAQLAIAAVVQIGVGLALSLLTRKTVDTAYTQGPRMEDLSVTSSAYGQYRPMFAGTTRAAGNMIWSPGIQEHSNSEVTPGPGKSAGKGGGGGDVVSTTYTYTASMALAFGETIALGGVASDLIRIYADGKLIYDKTGNNAGLGMYRFRFYTGSEDQLPDPTIEANIGAGRTPAYRGTCYMVCVDWPLADFGNRIPNITCEIAMVSENHAPYDYFAMPASPEYVPGSATGGDQTHFVALDPNSDAAIFMSDIGAVRASLGSMTVVASKAFAGSGGLAKRLLPDGFLYGQDQLSNFSPMVQYDQYTLEPTGVQIGEASIFGTGVHFETSSYIGGVKIGRGRPGATQQIAFVSSPQGAGGFQKGGVVATYKIADAAKANASVGSPATPDIYEQNFDALTTEDIGDAGYVLNDPQGRFCLSLQESSTFLNLVLVSVAVGSSAVSVNLGAGNTSTSGTPVFVSTVKTTREMVITKADEFPNGAGAHIEGWCALPLENAIILSDGTGMIKIDLENFLIIASNGAQGFLSQDQYTQNGTFAFVDPADPTSIVTISTDDLSVLARQSLVGVFDDGGSHAWSRSGYDHRNHSIVLIRKTVGQTPAVGKTLARLLLNRGSGLSQSLDQVVAGMCQRAGLSADQYDVTSLADQEVDGYSLTRQGAARDGLQPLMQAYLFEGVESDWKMKFVPRGSASVITVPEDDIGQLRSEDTQDPTLKETIQLETELPGRLSINYFDKDNDYQSGSQSAKRFVRPFPTQFANNETTLDLSLVASADQIKQLAEKALYTVWAERVSLQSQLPWRYLLLDPTDVFTLAYRGEDRLVRLAKAELGADLMIAFTASQEDSRTSVSTASGNGGDGVPQQVVPSGLPSRLLLLDCPLLLDADDGLQQYSAGYWAGSGYDDTWRGATLDRSTDEGVSFVVLASSTNAAAWGRVDGTLADPSTAGNTRTWNEAGTLDVKVMKGIDKFVTNSELDVLAGANALLVTKRDGTCEIIQFQNATQIDDGTVRLTRLLRGRRGTEPNSYAHDVNSEVILLERGAVQKLRIALSDLGNDMEFKAPSIGQSLEQTEPTFFSFTGQDLAPYSVVDVQASRNGSGDLTLTWKHRSRYNGQLRDLTSDIPLNEAEELYDVDLVIAGVVRYSATDLDEETVTVTAAEWTGAGNIAGDVNLINGDFEVDGSAWTITGDGLFTGLGLYATSSGGIAGPHSGTKFLYCGASSVTDFIDAQQDINLFLNGWDQTSLDAAQPSLTLAWYQTRDTGANNDTLEVKLEFFKPDGVTSSGSATTGAVIPTAGSWQAASLVASVPVGTQFVRVHLIASRAAIGLDVPNVGVDSMTLVTGVGVPRVVAYVYQKSAIVGRGRVEPVGV